jgi:hypothetical protein
MSFRGQNFFGMNRAVSDSPAIIITTITTPGSGTFTVPDGVTELTISVYGAGGGSGGSNNTAAGGGGGGGGGYSTDTYVVSPAQEITYIVGTGGVAGSSTTTGGKGFDTYVIGVSSMIAYGGLGGAAYSGGSGGGAAGTASGGLTNLTGDNGGNGTVTSGGSGGANNGPDGGATVAGPTVAPGTGLPGNLNGGGAAGSARRLGGVSWNGAAGANGAIVFEYTA